ncbi:MAG: PTS sugar transporter [Lachnospiraceae bacterium]|nr:PTS sugar transporter [Lachnospiraceae bacterium]
MKRIAVIGSSGGNLYSQGGNNIDGMMKEIFMQTESAGMEVVWLQFVGASGSMDTIGQDSPASLFCLENGKVKERFSGSLNKVNEQAEASDLELAERIRAGEIDTMMLLSADPNGVNRQAIMAAAEKKIPLVGTGGSSIAAAQNLGAHIISASGTTGTTSRTRAVAFTTALAKEWGLKYMPVIGNTGASAAGKIEANIWKRIRFRGIMMTSLPAFIAMALALALGKIPGLGALEDVFNTLIGALPIVVSAVAAKQISGLDEVGIVAGVTAGILSVDGGIIGGLCAGIFSGIFAYYIIVFCFRHKVPGTTANICAAGIGGLAAGLICLYLISPAALILGNKIRDLIDTCLAFNPMVAGLVAGLLIWPSIIGGVYHAAILPIVLLEMEAAGTSFLGAIDMTGLVVVSAGITLANVIYPKQRSDSSLALPGLLINVFFGTFVEASYPFMFSNKLVFAGALLAAAVSGGLVGALGVRGTAYVPIFSAPGVANEGKGMAYLICILVAFVIALTVTLLANRIERRKYENTKKDFI